MQFNPNEHMLQLKSGKGVADYLPVQFRLVWFRDQCPEGTIETEEVVVDLDREITVEVSVWNNDTRRSEKIQKTARGYARFRATVTDGKGGRATATGSESAVDFSDYTEKAETKAVGRALAMLGYGTQFAPELDEQHRIVDAPVEKHTQPTQAAQSKPPQNHQQPTESEQEAYKKRRVVVGSQPEPIDEAPATEPQMASIRKLYEALGLQVPARSLTYAQAKSAITRLEDAYKKKQAEAKHATQDSAASVDEISRDLLAKKQSA